MCIDIVRKAKPVSHAAARVTQFWAMSQHDNVEGGIGQVMLTQTQLDSDASVDLTELRGVIATV